MRATLRPLLLSLAFVAASGCADAPAPTATPALAAPEPARAASQVTLQAVVRDFRAGDPTDPLAHPDFENAIGAEQGLVAATLGADRKPVFSGIAARTVASAASFDQWWRNSPRSQFTRVPIVLAEDPVSPGRFRYESSSFFPIDGQLLGNERRLHNYHFTVEIHAMFTYRGGEQFSITADDDSWLFINGKLVIDRGGVQGQVQGSVNLDDLGLVRGDMYTFDLFHVERHTTESSLRIITNLGLFLPYDPYDPNPPTVTGSVAGVQGANGWYTGDVTVTWVTNDDEVPITSAPCAPATVSADTRGTTLTCTVTAGAWTKSGTVVVKRDATAPTIAVAPHKATYSTAEAIEIGCSASDATSGIATTDCVARRFEPGALAVGSHQETFTATDAAGNRATATATFAVVAGDVTPPTITASVSGPRSASGWYTGDAIVRWIVSDPESSVSGATGCGEVSVTQDTGGVTFTCTATSAGGTASAQVTVRRDATRPVLAFTGNAAHYDVADRVHITCAASDVTSGLLSSDCPSLDADASAVGAGSHLLGATATDRAGNTATAQATFTVTASYDGVATLVRRWVHDAGLEKSLLAKLDNAHRQSGAFNPSGANMIRAFVSEVQAQAGRKIAAGDAQLLVRYALML